MSVSLLSSRLSRASWTIPVLTVVAASAVIVSACEPSAELPGSGDEAVSPDPSAVAASFSPGEAKPNAFWWPERVNLEPLRQNAADNPYGADFNYAAEFESLDLDAVKADLEAVLTDSQDWWPADYGNYGPLFIRMAWHSAGTYRISDGRGGADGGQQRFEPLNSWPDNGNLDKARRLVWPVKQKYGRALSWADLMVLAGNVSMESMGFETIGFAGGREDDWVPELVYWGPEAEMLGGDARYHGARELEEGLGAVQMGLIYVNPEGPNSNHDPVSAAYDIRDTFARMAMNDEETVALIAGGHTFGKAHGAHPPGDCVGAAPAGASVEQQGFGWANSCGTGVGVDTTTSGLEGAWTAAPVSWTHQYLSFLFDYEWETTQSPAGATQWRPTDRAADVLVPDAHDAERRHAPMMLTTDLSMREDESYEAISLRFHENPEQFEDAFGKAWFKLTHRDLGPRTRYLGAEVPQEVFIWQDPLPEVDHALITSSDADALKRQILAAGLTTAELVRTAWASAATFRRSDMRGSANGARVRLAPQNEWSVNDPAELSRVLTALEGVQSSFNAAATGTTQVSLADVIVLGGVAAIEDAAAKGGLSVEVPFTPGRVDASAEQTDVASFEPLEPQADGFRNYYSPDTLRSPSDALIDKADLLDLTVPQMTALLGGMRVLGGNAGGSAHGVFTDTPGTLSNDFFTNLTDLSTSWRQASEPYTFEGVGADGTVKWTATQTDLVFGSNAELRAVSEVYAYDEAKFAQDFVEAWTYVMQADRFDLHR